METYFEEVQALLERRIGCCPDDEAALAALWEVQAKRFVYEWEIYQHNDPQESLNETELPATPRGRASI